MKRRRDRPSGDAVARRVRRGGREEMAALDAHIDAAAIAAEEDEARAEFGSMRDA